MLHSPGTVIASDLPPPEAAKTETPPATETTPTTGVKPESPAAPVDVKALMEAINADRVQREKIAKEAEERAGWQKRAEEAEKQLQAIEKAKKNRLLDPAGYLRKMGYTDRDLALTSEGIMYSLMPDKAPPGWIHNLVNAQREMDQQDREEQDKAREAEAQKRAAEAKTLEEKEIETRYLGSLEREVAALKPGTFKASQAWFAEDHKGYAQELFDTARGLAEAAMKAGKTIDNVSLAAAQELEKKYEERGKRLAGIFSTAPAPTQLPKPTPKPATSSLEEKPTSDTGTREPIAKSKYTEKDLIERAARAAFGSL